MSDNTPPHARAFDLPGWPCPPRAAQILDHPGSYGWTGPFHVHYDDDGYLWVDATATLIPSPRGPLSSDVCLTWTEDGIGLWAHRRGYDSFQRSEKDKDELIPIAHIVPQPPATEIT